MGQSPPPMMMTRAPASGFDAGVGGVCVCGGWIQGAAFPTKVRDRQFNSLAYAIEAIGSGEG